jgi:hypothetical protein
MTFAGDFRLKLRHILRPGYDPSGILGRGVQSRDCLGQSRTVGKPSYNAVLTLPENHKSHKHALLRTSIL